MLVAVAYTVLLGWWTRREHLSTSDEISADLAVEARITAPAEYRRRRLVWFLLLLLAGIAVIVVGADWLVRGSVELARVFGVSDAFIGLTVVAIGTSAPELVTALVSTLRGDRDIAVGNLIGSSVYNLTLILGVPVLVANGSGPIENYLLHIDLPLMVGVCLLCVPLYLTGRRLSRAEGACMVAGYALYLGYLLIARS